jgi:hypothetical protein
MVILCPMNCPKLHQEAPMPVLNGLNSQAAQIEAAMLCRALVCNANSATLQETRRRCDGSKTWHRHSRSLVLMAACPGHLTGPSQAVQADWGSPIPEWKATEDRQDGWVLCTSGGWGRGHQAPALARHDDVMRDYSSNTLILKVVIINPTSDKNREVLPSQ